MEKEIIGLHQKINGKEFKTYHVVRSSDYKRIMDEVVRCSIDAFPTLEEANVVKED